MPPLRSIRPLSPPILLLLLGALALLPGCGGCDDSTGGGVMLTPPGELCEDDGDCFNGFTCDAATGRCVASGGDADNNASGDAGDDADPDADPDAAEDTCVGIRCAATCEPTCPAGEVCVEGTCICEPGAERPCGNKLGECRYGVQTCGDQVWGECVGGVQPAEEACDYLDNDCDGQIDEQVEQSFFADLDNDGFGDNATGRRACAPDEGFVTTGGDCDDANADINPEASERCNTGDDDCDGQIDEGTVTAWFRDGDGDGFGLSDDMRGGCVQPEGYTAASGDCDDDNVEVHPDADERCNGVDDDCDGVDDTVDTLAPPPADVCPTAGICAGLGAVCTGAEGWSCTPPDGFEADETLCDGLDNDCDGTTDEGLTRSCGMSVGVCTLGIETCQNGTFTGCTATTGIPPTDSESAVNACDNLDNDCDGMTDEGCACQSGDRVPCGSTVGECSAGFQTCINGTFGACSGQGPVAEFCDNAFLDHDCNGQDDIQQGLATRYYVDTDRDGVGAGTARYRCGALAPGESATNNDCNDNNAAIRPGAQEVCNGVDDNCDGAVDNNPAAATTTCNQQGVCAGTQPTCQGTSGWVCVYNAPTRQTTETLCDGLDNDCDGLTDEDLTIPAFNDSDRDGFGFGAQLQVCGPLRPGQSANANDCNDANRDINPDADEICFNAVDEDCDGDLDNGCQTCNRNVDADFDGANQCDDCDDANGAIRPGAAERCNGVDDDCDGRIDEDFDQDSDTWSICATDPAQVDCNDNDAAVHPTAPERCGADGRGNGIDDNCNGYIDEGCNPCNSNDTDGDGVSQCQGDCAPGNGAIYPGAAEQCDGLDNDCNTFTTLNCDVSDTCNWASASDVCKDDLICACVVNASGSCNGNYICTAFCNTSATGALGDGCEADQACSYDLLRTANVHGCAVIQDTLGARRGGETCGNDAECRSHSCVRVATGPNGRICLDYCGSDDYCDAPNTRCRVERSTSNIDGRCWPTSFPVFGASAVGASCTTDTACDHGFCTTDGASRYCTEACCTDADCGAGFHCGLRGDAVDTTYVTVPPDAADCTSNAQCPATQVCLTAEGKCAWRLVETAPVCLRDTTGQGTRQAGAACTSNTQCQSNFCERDLGVCIDVCCADDACPEGLTCELQTIQTRTDRVTASRVCLNLSTDDVLERR